MKVTIYSAPAVEPISLAQAKLSLLLDSETFGGNVTLYTCFAAGSHGIANNYTTHVGTGIEVINKEAVVFLQPVNNGTNGTVDVKIQESDDNATYTDWTGGAFTQITEANDTTLQDIEYTGSKRYIRTVAKVLVAACEFGTSVLVNAATTAQDDNLTEDIQTAREHVEDITRRQLITATWDYFIDAFPSDKNYFELPFGNLQSVTYVKYKDSDGDETTMTVTTEYLVETNGDQCGRIVLPYGCTWPSFTPYPSNPISIRFVCGYGATGASVPKKIIKPMKMIIADLWHNRESQMVSAQGYVENKTVERLLVNARLWGNFL